MEKKEYTTGTILKCSINSLPFIYHYGVILNEGNGILKVIHNAPIKNKYGGGINVDSLDKFLKTRKIDEAKPTKLTRKDILLSVNKYVKQPFNLITWNCEHYITKLQTGYAQSPQIRNGAKLSAYLVFILIAITKNPKKMNKNTIFTVLSILVAVIGLYFIYTSYYKKNKNVTGTNQPGDTTPAIQEPGQQNPALVVIDQPGTNPQGNYWDSIPDAV